MDSSVFHDGGIWYSEETNLIIQFTFSNGTLPVDHMENKGKCWTRVFFQYRSKSNFIRGIIIQTLEPLIINVM